MCQLDFDVWQWMEVKAVYPNYFGHAEQPQILFTIWPNAVSLSPSCYMLCETPRTSILLGPLFVRQVTDHRRKEVCHPNPYSSFPMAQTHTLGQGTFERYPSNY